MTTTETLDFGAPSGSTDQADGSQLYVMGLKWKATQDGSWTGNRWLRVPDSVGGNNHYMLAYVMSDEDVRASKAFVPAVGTQQDVTFTTPIAITAGVEYVATVLTNHYVFTGSYPFPETDGRLIALGSRLVTTIADVESWPSSDSAANFFLSPIVVFEDEAEPVTVALTPAVLTLTAVALTPTPGAVTVALTAAALTLTAVALTPTSGVVTVALTPAVLVLAAVRLFIAGQSQPPDLDIVVGEPCSAWATGEPRAAWDIGSPR